MHLNLKENNNQMHKIITCITSTDMAAEIEAIGIERQYQFYVRRSYETSQCFI
jgi:hypothetical protein